MSRIEEIVQAANENYPSLDSEKSYDGFKDGAKWADKHPSKETIERICKMYLDALWTKSKNTESFADVIDYIKSTFSIQTENDVQPKSNTQENMYTPKYKVGDYLSDGFNCMQITSIVNGYYNFNNNFVSNIYSVDNNNHIRLATEQELANLKSTIYITKS